MVIFNDFGKSAQLPTGETVPIEFLPEKPGEYEFTCQMGMLRGKLIVSFIRRIHSRKMLLKRVHFTQMKMLLSEERRANRRRDDAE
jgi:plastocyanin domain-containing protein